MNLLAHIADRIIARPLLVHPLKVELIASILGERIGIEGGNIDISALPRQLTAPIIERPAANRNVGEPVYAGRDELYRRVNGVGVVPIVGTLVNRGVAIGEDSSGFTSYEGIGAQLRAAVDDPKVQAIMLDIDSAGGEASGMFSLASAIRAARQQKPVLAVVDDMAASAGYGLASSASEISVSPTSVTGSIGVVLMHLDRSGEMQMKGRKPTLIYAGAHKVDGHPFGPLSESVKADLTKEVETFYSRFVESVSAGRPKLTEKAIRDTEARTYIGSEAVDLGLADRTETFDEALARMSSAVRATTHQGVYRMNAPTDTIPRAEHDAALAQARTDARREGEAAGRQATTDRIRAILTCEAAKDRMPQATILALDSDVSAEVAQRMLEATPAGKAPTAPPPLDQRGEHPVHSGAAADPKADTRDRWNRSLSRAGATLRQ